MSPFGLAHVVAATTAIVSGGWVLLARKGTPGHRVVGRIYAAAILLINGSAFSIYELTGGFNVFHMVAIVNLTSLSLGLWALWRWRRTRDPVALRQHKVRMAMSYVGLMMAFASELAVNPTLGLARRMASAEIWPMLGWLNAAMFLVGVVLVQRAIPRAGHRVAG